VAEEAGLQLVAAVADAAEVLAQLNQGPVDVVAVELAGVGWDVAEAVNQMRRRAPDVFVVGMHAGRRLDHAETARVAGVDALAPARAGASALFQVLRHRCELPPRTVTERRGVLGVEGLTRRERQVLEHIASGRTVRETAELLRVSPKTVDNHKQRLFSKLGVQNQAHAVAVAHRLGLVRRGVRAGA
jgi:DNA-binding NarL/FixJ family response regulator